MALALSMSNHQAIQALTINAAKMSFKDKDLGSIEPGKLADLTIVDGNPLEDLKWAGAVQVRREERRRLLARPDHRAFQVGGSGRWAPGSPRRVRQGLQGRLEELL